MSDKYDYLYYVIDMVAMVLALIFSLTDAYAAGASQLVYKIPLVVLSVLFKYIYLTYYAVMQFLLYTGAH